MTSPPTSGATAFDDDDLALLLERYDTPANDNQPRRPPWTWAALDQTERAALARMIDVWVDTYNHIHAITPTELIPPCWPRHPALATELAVQLWLWYHAHMDPRTTPLIAGDYYLRHLPGFRSRIDRLLGASPGECRRGEHPNTWRHDTDAQLAINTQLHSALAGDREQVALLGELHFGFPHLNDYGQR